MSSKHSQADSCQIRLRRDHGIVLEFEDDGCGFEEVTGQELHSIRERLSLVDGDLEILLNRIQPLFVYI